MSNKLLSICIPTYNRAEVLDRTLGSLLSNPEFDPNKIEVIVSDNHSTDQTSAIVAKYPLVRYYKNVENVKDHNYAIVLGYATGDYIRLFNDTLSFKKGVLRSMLNRIEENKNGNCNLFYYADMFLNKGCKREIVGKRDLLSVVSFYTTWIANFGCWRKDFEKINDKDRYAALQFVQVDWTYQIVGNDKKTIIYFDDLFSVTTPNKKGGYNIFDTFINKYLYIIKQERLSILAYEVEKYRLFRYFVYPWLNKLLIAKEESFNFEIKAPFKIILKKYWYEPYLYPFLLLFSLKKRTDSANNVA